MITEQDLESIGYKLHGNNPTFDYYSDARRYGENIDVSNMLWIDVYKDGCIRISECNKTPVLNTAVPIDDIATLKTIMKLKGIYFKE